MDERLWKQCLKYEITLKQSLQPLRRDQCVKSQCRNYAAAAQRFRQVESMAMQVLMMRGVMSREFVTYLNFVRHLAKARDGFTGEDFALECRAMAARWEGLGCDRAVLLDLALNVFNVDLGLAQKQ